MTKACLFDLDGVVFDTEPLYTIFYRGIFKKYYPEEEGIEYKIKGQTLREIYDAYFPDNEALQTEITRQLYAYEAQMPYRFVEGLVDFVEQLKQNGIKTAIVTSSNKHKMENVYAQHTCFKQMFGRIFTSDDFTESKPSPEPYITAARHLGVPVEDCVVFEDSFNGLRSGIASKARVVGLATSNSAESIKAFTNEVIENFIEYEL